MAIVIESKCFYRITNPDSTDRVIANHTKRRYK